jgi:hypothetical protein
MKRTSLALMAGVTALALVWPAGVAVAQVSEAAVLWLLISPGSRPAGMGESFVALADDATATWWNPAGLAFQRGRDIRLMHSNWLPAFNLNDIYFDFVAGSFHVPNLGGTVGVNVIYMNEGDQTWTNESGDVLGVITSREYALGVNYGTTLNPDLGVGMGLKFIISDLADGVDVGNQKAGTGYSFAVDLGTLYKTRLPFTERPLNLGVNLANFGPEISYADEAQADPLPTNLKLGFALNVWNDPHNEVNFVFDVNKQLVRKSLSDVEVNGVRDTNPGNPDDPFDPLNPTGWANLSLEERQIDNENKDVADIYTYETDPAYKALFTSWFDEGLDQEFRNYVYNVGCEYWYRAEASNLGQAAFGVRAGYLNDIAGSIKSYTLGSSIQVNLVEFDFSYELSVDPEVYSTPRDKTMRFSLGFNF